MSGTDPLTRWRAGATATDFTPPEALALAEHLMQARASVYGNAKHPDHATLSQEVQELMARGAPGSLGPGGEVVGGGNA